MHRPRLGQPRRPGPRRPRPARPRTGTARRSRSCRILPKASVQAGYTYAFVEKALQTIKIDRSNGFFDVGYPLKRSFFVRGSAVWQHTHGGLRAGSVTGDPFPFPGELNTPERFAQRDRLLRTHYWQMGGGLAYSAGAVDVFASVTKYVWGRDAHNGQAFTFGTNLVLRSGEVRWGSLRGGGMCGTKDCFRDSAPTVVMVMTLGTPRNV